MPRFRPYNTIPRILIPIPESADMSINQGSENNSAMNSANNAVRNIMESLKIPDAVKDLPKFDGNPRLLYDFINNVEEILSVLTPIDSTPFAKMILRAIRNKIEGEANEILNMYSTNLNWQDIRNNLILHYSDKRNETSLIRDLHLLKQYNKTVEEFYSSVVEIQATINNNLMIHEVDSNIITAKRDLFAKMCLNTFLSGLREPLGSSIRAMKPESLPIAFSYCVTEQNMFYIKQENRNPIRKQENPRQFNAHHFYPQHQRPFFTGPQQHANRNPPMYYNRPQLPINQPITRPQLRHNNSLPTPRQTYNTTNTNNQNHFNNSRQPYRNTNNNTNYQPPEPMDTSSGYTHLRNNSAQTQRFPREIHHYDQNFENVNTFEDCNVPQYVPNMDIYNEIEDVQNFQLNAFRTQRDT